jgi:uncharacterized protein (UPF0332 family)
MTDKLDDNSRKEMIKYRISKAKDSINEAKFCASGNFYIIAINRLYYACYYAATALLLKYGYECGTHNGVKAMLNLHFVVPGKIDRDVAKTLSQLYECRQSGDYDDFVYFNEDDYANLAPKAEKFIEAIEQLIN